MRTTQNNTRYKQKLKIVIFYINISKTNYWIEWFNVVSKFCTGCPLNNDSQLLISYRRRVGLFHQIIALAKTNDGAQKLNILFNEQLLLLALCVITWIDV